jgi:phage/plasmid-like protein (TIGR03299 family)
MSHNLTFNSRTGQYEMFAATDKHGMPWHKLGQTVGQAQTWADAIKLAHLDWPVNKEQLLDQRGKKIDAYGIFRADTNSMLGVVGSVYRPIQNVEMGQHIDDIIGSISGAHYESAGSLDGGSRVWAMARIPTSDFEPIPGDTHKAFLLATTSHDGTMSYIIKAVSTRVVCQNTMSMALREKGQECRTKHTENAQARLKVMTTEARGIADFFNRQKAQLSAIAQKKIDKETARKVMDKLFGEDWRESTRKKNQVQEIANLFATAEQREGTIGAPGTGYALYNAITDWVDHWAPVRNGDGTQSLQATRTQKAIWNGGEKTKQAALDAILDAVGYSAPIFIAQPDKTRVDSILDKIAI